MARGKERTERRRVSPQNVRNNAVAGGRGYNFFNLPKDVREWKPEKAQTYELDFLGYEVKSKDHPDKKQDVGPGAVWYKYPFVVFKKVGINEETIISAASIGQPCPLMEKYRQLCENYKENEAEIKALQMQKWVVFALRDPDDADKVAVYPTSAGKLWSADAGLENELQQTEDENLLFYEYKGGKTLKCRFTEKTFSGNKYLECTKIDFMDREDVDEEEWIKKVPCLDEIFITLPYDTVKAMWAGAEVEGNDEGGKPSQTAKPRSATASGSASGKGGTKPKTPEPEPEAEEGEELAEIEVGDMVSFKNKKGKVVKGTVTSIDGDDVTVTDKDDNESDAEMDDLTLVEKGAQEESDQEQDDTPSDETPKGGKRIPKVGDKIKDDEGREGVIIKVMLEDTDVMVRRPNGKEAKLDFTEVVEYLDDAEEPEKNDAPEFKVGDKVKWDDDGLETGVITKMLEDEAKVKNDDGSGIERVPFDKLSLNKKGK